MAGIYIHIPFCRQACNYCNFYFSTSMGNKDKFLAALLKEIELSKDYLQGEKVETLYFGGGTPSLLSAEELESIILQLNKYHNLQNLSEFTLEANPDDLSEKKIEELSRLKQYGFNRFSIGVQSFIDADLQYMNRAHNSNEALTSIKRVQDAGFENITIDLIYGTPTMNDEGWSKNLEQALGLNIPHISSYALTVEPKTALDQKIKTGKAKPVNEEQAERQFKMLMQSMKAAGYEPYEISNFAKPGKFAIHNSNYWFGKKYLGLGPSAHSFNGNSRHWNVANNINYANEIAKGILPFEEEVLTDAQKINERIMTSLRTQWGLRIADLGATAEKLIMEDLKEVNAGHYTLNEGIMRLTDEGKLFADAIAASLFIEE